MALVKNVEKRIWDIEQFNVIIKKRQSPTREPHNNSDRNKVRSTKEWRLAFAP